MKEKTSNDILQTFTDHNTETPAETLSLCTIAQI